jgi:cellulose synthase/poly-beta-1,6-N-acetylglucosamine synthase-like glycosyltransferase
MAQPDGGDESAMADRAPAVSVIVPFRDRRDLVRALLDGLEAQTFTDVEVLLVDDGSTDGAPDEAEGRCVGRRPVRVLRHAGSGAVSARQAGVREAHGKVLAFTDSDCVPEPGWLAAGVAAVEAGADVVQGHTHPARRRGPLERSLWVEDEGLYPTCNVFYRRTAFDAVGGFDEGIATRYGFRADGRAKGLGFGEDTLLGWRVRRVGTARYEPAAVVAHHVFHPDVPDQLSRTLQAAAFPALVAEIPELRTTFLHHRVLLGPGRLPLYGALAAGVARRQGAAGALLGLWAVGHWRRLRRNEPSAKRCAKALPVLLASDVLTAGALVVGSVRARTVVL